MEAAAVAKLTEDLGPLMGSQDVLLVAVDAGAVTAAIQRGYSRSEAIATHLQAITDKMARRICPGE